MVGNLYVAILDRNKLRIKLGNEAHLHIEVWGGGEENFINFRVVGASEGRSVELRIDESYNQHNEDAKCVNFIVKQKDE